MSDQGGERESSLRMGDIWAGAFTRERNETWKDLREGYCKQASAASVKALRRKWAWEWEEKKKARMTEA